jgi:hypothetical protein
MLALISPMEKVIDYLGNEGVRICQVESISFEVAQPLFWTACQDDCNADTWYYIQEQCRPIPQPTIIDGAITEVTE